MQKARIKIEINDHIIEGMGLLDDSILKLEHNEEKIEFNLNRLILFKANKDLELKLDFIKKEALYELVEEKQKFSNEFEVLSLTNADKQVMINYQIEHTDFSLKIKYETI